MVEEKKKSQSGGGGKGRNGCGEKWWKWKIKNKPCSYHVVIPTWSNMLARWLLLLFFYFLFFSLLYIKHNISLIFKKIIIYNVIITKKNYKKLLRLELLLHNKISLTQKIFHFVSIITGNLLDSNGFHYLVQIPWAHVSSETFPYIITGNCTSVSMPSFVGLYYLILFL